MKYKIGQKVFYFTIISSGYILAHDTIRSIRGNDYSFVTALANEAWTKKEKELFSTEQEAFLFITRPLALGEGVFNAE